MWLSVAELAEQEGVSKTTVRRWVREGLPAVEGPDGSLIIHADDAAAFLDEEESEEIVLSKVWKNPDHDEDEDGDEDDDLEDEEE